MKSVLVLVAFFFVYSAQATEVTKLQKGDLGFYPTNAKIISSSELCPRVPGRVSCQAIGSIVKIKVPLQGCLDRVGGYYAHFEAAAGRGYIFFGAVGISNEASRRVRCVAAPTETITVTIPFEGKVELVNMDFSTTAQ